ncbi:MAG: helix-turn-helix domain-containing protein [Myxococcales bacterium]|nr:helix-turn-helix domain-containing protein [Myxococcales bacterium]MCB9575648.1 helix-turn-helix domain-containing protein [Polyangiaceae bacterium]
MSEPRNPTLAALGHSVRACRLGRELTLHALSERAGVSERFLAQLEAGQGNISVARLCDVAHALGTSAARLLEGVGEGSAEPGVVALLGLRGAGKSTIGPRLAQALSVPFVELDQLVERAAGMTLGEVFELQGEAFYRRLERETLRRVFADHPRAVIATGGSIVGDAESFDLLRRAATTVWLKAKPEDHMQRVRAQGDERPMRNRDDAMSELRALLRSRTPLYAQADHVVDTSLLGIDGSITALVDALSA